MSKTNLILISIRITKPETARLRVRVRFAGRGDSRGLQMRVPTPKTIFVPTSADFC
jgi:hypothetical protein